MTRKSLLTQGVSFLAIALSGQFAVQAMAQTADEGLREVEEIVVTGSYIRRQSQAAQASPISVIGQEELLAIGAADIADLTNSLTINNGAQNNPDAFTQNLTTGTESINLRGLGLSSTLVLMNGKRQVNSAAPTDDGINFVDTASLVPLIAIERTEIFKDGAAAIYGSDAVAGVVNFITRNNFEGFELRGEWQGNTNDSQNDFKIEGIFGAGDENTHIMVAASYLDRSQLTTRERDLRPEAFTGPNGLSVSGITATPGNFILLSPPVPQLNPANPDLPALATLFGILGQGNVIVPDPGCADAAAIDDDVKFAPIGDPVTNSGVNIAIPDGNGGFLGTCQYDFGRFFNLVPKETRLQGFATFTHALSDSVEFYSEFGFARNRAMRETSNFPIINPLFISPFNPFNPFPGAALFFVGRSPGIGQLDDFFTDSANPNFFRHNTYRAVAGLRGDIGDSWYYDLSYTRGINDYRLRSFDGLDLQTNLALNGFGGQGCRPQVDIPGTGNCFFYNPFASGFLPGPQVNVPVFSGPGVPLLDSQGNPVTVPLRNSREVLEFIGGEILLDGRSDLTVIDAVIAGDLFEMDAGPVSVALGFQYRDDRLSHNFDENTNRGNFLFVTAAIEDFDRSRDVYAFFGEVKIPLLENLELSAAVRFEDYGGGTGSTTDPRVAVLYQPTDWLSLRGSFSTAFRAPSIFQQFGNQTTLNSVEDPRNGARPFIAINTIGNEDLQPEESTNFNVGFTAEPVEGLEINVDFWQFDFDDIIIRQQPEEVARRALIPSDPNFDPDLLGTDVLLGPTGGLSFVRTQFTNAAGIKTNGVDASIKYQYDIGGGVATAGIEGTYVNKYRAPVGVGEAVIDVAGFRNSQNFAAPIPELRFNATLGYSYEGHNLVGFIRYTDGFKDDQNCGGGDSPADFLDVDANTLSCPSGTDFARIKSHTTVDLQYSYTFGPSGPLEGASLSIGSINVFNNKPPFVNTDGGFESRTHDPRGRMAYVRLTTRF